ncbi:MAG: PAS domain S-box protein, partial [bacterium]
QKRIAFPSCEGMLAFWGDQPRLTEKYTVDFLTSVGMHLGGLLKNFRILNREQFLEELVNNVFRIIPLGILIEDTQQNIQYVNPELCRMLTFIPEELVGREVGKILSIEEAIPTEIGGSERYIVVLRTSGGQTKKIEAKGVYIWKGMRVWIFPTSNVF